MTNTRDMGLPFPGVKFPGRADYLIWTRHYDFVYHDYFHALIASFVPAEKRVQFIHFSDLIGESLRDLGSSHRLNHFAQEFQNTVADMVHAHYFYDAQDEMALKKMGQRQIRSKDFNRFLYSIKQVEELTLSRLDAEEMLKQVENGEKIDHSKVERIRKELIDQIACSQFPKAIAKKMVRAFANFAESQAEWCKKIIGYGGLIEWDFIFNKEYKRMGLSLEFLRQSSIFVQGKLLCQNPYLLA